MVLITDRHSNPTSYQARTIGGRVPVSASLGRSRNIPFRFFGLILPATMILLVPSLLFMAISDQISNRWLQIASSALTIIIIILASAMILVGICLALPAYLRARRR